MPVVNLFTRTAGTLDLICVEYSAGKHTGIYVSEKIDALFSPSDKSINPYKSL